GSARDLSIVILTKNGGDLFADVLAGLFACAGISDAEVLIIDSDSSDNTLKHERQYTQIRIHGIPASEFGHGKTRNLGAQMTTRPIIVYLVQDATPAAPDFLKRLATPILEQGFAGVCGRQLPRPWTNRIERMFLGRTYTDQSEVRVCLDTRNAQIKVIFFYYVCLAILRDDL